MPTVLLVDAAFREKLHALFDHGSGFDPCVETRSSVEALEKTKRLSPNLAVLDLSFPDMSGLQLAEKLKAIMPELPIFPLTREYSVKLEKKAPSYGIVAVFSKLDDLATLVANARAVCRIE